MDQWHLPKQSSICKLPQPHFSTALFPKLWGMRDAMPLRRQPFTVAARQVADDDAGEIENLGTGPGRTSDRGYV